MHSKSLFFLAAAAPLAFATSVVTTTPQQDAEIAKDVQDAQAFGLNTAAATILANNYVLNTDFDDAMKPVQQKHASEWSGLDGEQVIKSMLGYANEVDPDSQDDYRDVLNQVLQAQTGGFSNQRRQASKTTSATAASATSDPDCSGDLSKLDSIQQQICESEQGGVLPAAASFLATVPSNGPFGSDLAFLQTQTQVPELVTNSAGGFFDIITQIEAAATLLPSSDRAQFTSVVEEFKSLQGTALPVASAPTGFSTATVLQLVTPTIRPSGAAAPSGVAAASGASGAAGASAGLNAPAAGAANNGTLATTASSKPSSEPSSAATNTPPKPSTSASGSGVHTGAASRSSMAMSAMGAALAGLVGVAFYL